MKEQFIEWQQKIDQLSQRERVLVFAVIAALLIFIMLSLLIDPVLKERSSKAQQVRQLQVSTASHRNELAIVNAELEAGVNRIKLQQRDRLIEQKAKLDQRIEQSVVGMIPPQMMTEVLETVLSQDSELQLLALENLPVAAIIEQSLDEGETIDDKLGLYKHRFVLTLRGNYLSTVRYFEKLKRLPWRFHWDSLNYEVTDFPNAIITLQVHTVSRSEDWIGV